MEPQLARLIRDGGGIEIDELFRRSRPQIRARSPVQGERAPVRVGEGRIEGTEVELFERVSSWPFDAVAHDGTIGVRVHPVQRHGISARRPRDIDAPAQVRDCRLLCPWVAPKHTAEPWTRGVCTAREENGHEQSSGEDRASASSMRGAAHLSREYIADVHVAAAIYGQEARAGPTRTRSGQRGFSGWRRLRLQFTLGRAELR